MINDEQRLISDLQDIRNANFCGMLSNVNLCQNSILNFTNLIFPQDNNVYPPFISKEPHRGELIVIEGYIKS